MLGQIELSFFTKIKENFRVDTIIAELVCKAPTLLRSCLKTKTSRPNLSLLITVIAAIICKQRRSSCSLFQRLISLVLYAGHSAKQVSCCINR